MLCVGQGHTKCKSQNFLLSTIFYRKSRNFTTMDLEGHELAPNVKVDFVLLLQVRYICIFIVKLNIHETIYLGLNNFDQHLFESSDNYQI